MRKAIVLLAAACAVHGSGLAQSRTGKPTRVGLTFRAAGTNGFTFDTGMLRGRLRAGGESKGLTEVVHVPSGITLDSSMGLFGHYRVFTADTRYGSGAWHWPSEAQLRADGSVEVRWTATKDRPFELRAVYKWATPSALDVETSVEARTNLTKFESFLASYFSPSFTNSLVYVGGAAGGPGVPAFTPAEQPAGVWQAFPRDDAAVSVIRDGRWTHPPSPVDWTIMPRLAKPIGLRRNMAAGLTAIVMAPPNDCFAVLTPHQTEAHRSMYLSLFGRDLKPGETASAHARLLIAAKPSDAEIVRAYNDYVKGLPAQRVDTLPGQNR